MKRALLAATLLLHLGMGTWAEEMERASWQEKLWQWWQEAQDESEPSLFSALVTFVAFTACLGLDSPDAD